MPLLRIVITASLIVAAIVAASISIADDQTFVTARNRSSASPRRVKGPSVTPRLVKLQDYDGIWTQHEGQNDEDRAFSWSAVFEAVLKWIRSFWDGTKTKTLIINVGRRMEKEEVIEGQDIIDMETFVELLRDEFRIPNRHWKYDDVVKCLTEGSVLDNYNIPRVSHEDLMEAFHLLREQPRMQVHADRMQSILANWYPSLLWTKLRTLWLSSKVTPEELYRILPTGKRVNFRSIREQYGLNAAADSYKHMLAPMFMYIDLYRAKYGYSKEAEKKLMKFYIEQAEYLRPTFKEGKIWSDRDTELANDGA
ncbi:unnamed protein product [Hyaloperonospora brassicae]|uniref:RxLR effector candidate protein n=1 Tax=Hyaloperonospora brassicae TaxID=162125 RepID=A0AAV0UVG1_HYABA|nr:unnamed protein product [Hyaloperonospora brassicae]